MIDQRLKRCLGQMIHGIQVVGAAHDGVQRLYTSHWVTQVSFEEPVIMASVSPKHDTYPLIVASGRYSVSVLAADQIEAGQYFSYPGRRFRHIATEMVETIPSGLPVVANSITWLECEVFQRVPMVDHELFFSRVVEVGAGRLREPPLLYSSRLGWRATGDRAREKGDSVRDRLLARLAAAGFDTPDEGDDDEDA